MKKINLNQISTSNHMGGRFKINCANAYLKILKFPGWNDCSFKILKNQEGDLSQNSPKSNMKLVVNLTKPINALHWNKYLLTNGNYKSAGNHKVTPLMVQCWLQSTMWLLQDIILQISFNAMQSIKNVLFPFWIGASSSIFFQNLSSPAILMS